MQLCLRYRCPGTTGIVDFAERANPFGEIFVAAIDVVRSPEVREKFGEMVYWLTIGQRPKPPVPELQSLLIAELNQTESLVYKSEIQAAAALDKALEGRQALVVLDDVWEREHAEAFDVRNPWVRILVTTQNSDVLNGLSAELCPLNQLPPDDALRLLAAWAKTDVEKLPQQARDLASVCEYLPLALAILGGLVRGGMSWSDLQARIVAAQLDRVPNPSSKEESTHRTLAAPFEVSVAALQPHAHERYLDLAVFPGNVAIPEKPLADLWGLEPIDARDLVRYLSNRCLLTDASPGEEGIRIHGLLRKMITAERESQLPELHRHLADAWGSSPERLDAYAWRWLGYHLLRGGRTGELSTRLLDGAVARAKLQATDLDALISDYDLLPNHEILGLIKEAILLSALAISRDPEQLAPQVIGRLLPYETIADVKSYAASLAAAAPRPWLRPRKPALQPPKAGLIFTLDTSPRRVNAVALTPDGGQRELLSGEDDGTLRLVDLASRRELYVLAGNGPAVRTVAITPNGRFTLSGGDDRLVWLRKLDDGSEVRSFPGHEGPVLAVAVTGHGSRAVSGSKDHTVRIWDLGGKSVNKAILTEHTDVVSAVAATPDGRFAVSGSWDGRVIVWDLAAGNKLRIIEGDAAISAIAITPDGRQCVWTSYDETLKVCDLQRRIAPTVLERSAGAANAVAVTADGHHAVSSHGETLRWWDLKSGTVGRSLTGHSGAVWSIALTADGSLAVTAADDRSLKVWDPRPSPVALPHPGRPGNVERHTGGVTGLAVSADGKQAVSGSTAGELKLWDIESGRLEQTLQVLAAKVWAVALTPDRSRVVAGCGAAGSGGRRSLSGGTLEVWDLESAKRVHTLTGHAARITAVAVTSDGRRVVSGSDDFTIRLWDIETGTELVPPLQHGDKVTSIALTPDGRHIVSGSGDRTIKLWELERGRLIRTYFGQADAISAVAVTGDGRRIVSGSLDSTLIMWDLETGEELLEFEKALAGPVYAVSLTHGDRYAVSASDDRTVSVWDMNTGKRAASFFCDAAAWSCATAPSSILAGDRSGNVYILALETGEAAS